MFRQRLYNLLLPLINRNSVKKNNFLKLLKKLFSFVFMSSKAIIFGSTMYLHKSGHSFELAFEGDYESLETLFLKDLNLKDRIAIDIGACIGYYTLLLSKLVGNNGKVLAFEPDIKNFRLLQKNIITNNLFNVLKYKLAVGDKDKHVYLKKGCSPGQHTITEDSNGADQVYMVSLDGFLKKHNLLFENIGYIKIDVEGYEFKVFQGMHDIMEKANNLIIQFEFAPQHLNEQNCELKWLVSLIKDYEFKTYYWDLKVKKLLKCKDLNWLIKKDVVEDFKKRDFLFEKYYSLKIRN